MILRRLTENLRLQNWTTIAIELAIVIIGVFVGNQVSNWNEGRLEKQATNRMLEQLRPELKDKLDFFETSRAYYETERRYAERAFAGWNRDPRISDNQFVIAAYQASQIYGLGINAQNWALTFGGEQMRDIADPHVRRDLAAVLTADYERLGTDAVATPYRQHIRQIIPDLLQEQIRRTCGDRDILREGSQYLIILPPSCLLRLDPAQARRTATALRAHPELVQELNWHLAMIANYRTDADSLVGEFRMLEKRLEQRS